MKKVLIADDEETVRRLVAVTLGAQGPYQVLFARDGQETLSMARQERPDLLLLDILMPKLDGFAVCQQLKQDPATAHTKVIMLTALNDPDSWRRGVAAGADDYFVKPFSPTALLRKVEQELGA